MAGSGYVLVKAVHIGCAALSLAGFGVRGVLVLAGSPWGLTGFARVAPHVVDTVLLASAIWLAVLAGQYPFADGWLTAKLLALVLYIVLGSIALRHGTRPPALRIAAFAGALATGGYIVSVALTRDPRGVLGWLLSG